MVQNSNLIKRILVLASIGVGVVSMWYFETGCLIQNVLKIPCMTCGMTRAFFALINGDFVKSFEFHPMLLSVPVLAIMFLFSEEIFSSKFKIPSTIILTLIIVGFVLNYIYKLFLFF